MKGLLRLAVLVPLLVSGSWAQEAPSNDTLASKEDIELLFATTHVRDRVHQSVETSIAQMRQALGDTLKRKYPDLSPKDADRLNSFFDQVVKDYDFEAMVNDMIPAYQRHLTKADVGAMLAFYKTPTGQKVISELPTIMLEANQAARPRMEKAVAMIMDQAEKMFAETHDSAPAAKH